MLGRIEENNTVKQSNYIRNWATISDTFKKYQKNFNTKELAIFVPICVYSESNNKITEDNFTYLTEELLEYKRLRDDCSFNIFFFENEKDAIAVDRWRSLNGESLNSLGEYGIRVPEWREKNTELLKRVRELYDNFLSDPLRKAARDRELKLDVEAYLKRANTENKKKLPGYQVVTREEAENHVIAETIDTLAQAELLEDLSNPYQEPSRLTIILHPEKLSRTAQHAIKCLKEIGFVARSLYFILLIFGEKEQLELNQSEGIKPSQSKAKELKKFKKEFFDTLNDHMNEKVEEMAEKVANRVTEKVTERLADRIILTGTKKKVANTNTKKHKKIIKIVYEDSDPDSTPTSTRAIFQKLINAHANHDENHKIIDVGNNETIIFSNEQGVIAFEVQVDELKNHSAFTSETELVLDKTNRVSP